MKQQEIDFTAFVEAVEKLELEKTDVKATAHTSAVSVRWDQIEGLLREDDEERP